MWLLSAARKHSKALLQSFWIVGLLLAVTEPWSIQTRWRGLLDLPAGRTALTSNNQYEKYSWMLHQTRPSEFFFEAAPLPRLYFLMGLRDPARVPYLTHSDYTRPDQVKDVLEVLDTRKVRYVLWSSDLDSPESPAPAGDHLAPLRAYVCGHYHVVKNFEDFEQIWERNR